MINSLLKETERNHRGHDTAKADSIKDVESEISKQCILYTV